MWSFHLSYPYNCLRNKMACIGVVGIGKLGLPLALCIEKAGYTVIGMDIREDYIKELKDKTFKSDEPHLMDYLQKAKNFTPTNDLKEVARHCDVIFFVILTPGDGNSVYSTVYLDSALQQLAQMQIANKHIVIGCTVTPGFFKKCRIFDNCRNVTLSYNPEFVAIGEVIEGYQKATFILIGSDSQEAANAIKAIHHRVCRGNPTIHHISLASAEITKLAINCFVTTKISFSNMIGDIADRTEGANAVDILNCIGSDPRVGARCLKAGHGYGGPCFHRDNSALGAHAIQVGVKPVISLATDEYNNKHNDFLVETIMKQNPLNYTIRGIGYKKGVGILEHSQPLVVAEKLVKNGVNVVIQDTANVIREVKKLYPEDFFQYKIDN